MCVVSWKMMTAGPKEDRGTSRPQRVDRALSSGVKCFRYAPEALLRNWNMSL